MTQKVKMKLEGLDGNAFNLLGVFSQNAKRQGWKQEEIKAVCDTAMQGDYDHLLRTLSNNIEDPDQQSFYGDDDDDDDLYDDDDDWYDDDDYDDDYDDDFSDLDDCTAV